MNGITPEVIDGMEPQTALSLMSDDNQTYRILFKCGRAEAAERQRRAGCGEVVNEGFVRNVQHEWFADMARADPDAEVEVLED